MDLCAFIQTMPSLVLLLSGMVVRTLQLGNVLSKPSNLRIDGGESMVDVRQDVQGGGDSGPGEHGQCNRYDPRTRRKTTDMRRQALHAREIPLSEDQRESEVGPDGSQENL